MDDELHADGQVKGGRRTYERSYSLATAIASLSKRH